jgi:mono/diheme cytochrome c family protein
MKLIKAVVILLLLAVVAAALFGWYEIHRGFSARETPSSIEAHVAATARRLAVPSSYRQLHNSLSASPENIRAGMEHFADHCAVCHANDGGADTLLGRNMYPKPPDMRKTETQNKTDGELYYTIQNGIRLSGMPAFGEEHGTGEMNTWKLVLFIRHLPNLSAEEVIEMKQLNPKTSEDRREEKEEQEFLRGGNPQTKAKKSHHH